MIGSGRTELTDTPDNLVSQNEWVRRIPGVEVTLVQFDVGPTDRGHLYLEQQVVLADVWGLELLKPHFARVFQHHGLGGIRW